MSATHIVNLGAHVVNHHMIHKALQALECIELLCESIFCESLWSSSSVAQVGQQQHELEARWRGLSHDIRFKKQKRIKMATNLSNKAWNVRV